MTEDFKNGLCVTCGRFEVRAGRPEIWTCSRCTVDPLVPWTEEMQVRNARNWEKIRIGQAAGCRF